MKNSLCVVLFLVSCASHSAVQTAPIDKVSGKNVIRMAITVDDLPEYGVLPPGASRMDVAREMVEAFKKYSVPEVYGFVNDSKMEVDPKLIEVLQFWVDSGHRLGNHTYSHKDLNKVSSEDYKAEIDRNEKSLESLGQTFDWKYFRYPFLSEGNTMEKRNAIRDHLKSRGYKIAEVTVNTKDWAWDAPYTRCLEKKDQQSLQMLKELYVKNAVDQLHRSEKISKALFHRQIVHVLLFHVGAFSAGALEDLLKAYQQEGVEFVSLTEANKDPVYSIDPAVISASEFTLQIMKSRNISRKDIGIVESGDDGYPKEIEMFCL